MVQTLQARNVTIRDLIDNSKLELVHDRDFFTEWREHLPELTDPEKQMLDIVQAGFFNLMEYPPYLEKAVQISVLPPLLTRCATNCPHPKPLSRWRGAFRNFRFPLPLGEG